MLQVTEVVPVQDKFLYGQRAWDGRDGLTREAEKLRILEGLPVPHLYGFDGRTLIREYLNGRVAAENLRDNTFLGKTLEGGVELLDKIHQREVAVGDASVKNLFWTDKGVYWLDLEGGFDEMDLLHSQAVDVLKFVYSTWTLSRSRGSTLYAAEAMAKAYSYGPVKEKVKDLLAPLADPLRLWFPTRMPLDGKLLLEVKMILAR